MILVFLSVVVFPHFTVDVNAESNEICINKVWIENSKGKIACVTSSTAVILVERGWGILIGELTDGVPLESPSIEMQETPFASISVMAFGPDNVLFIGDSRESKIVAIELGDAIPNTESESYNLYDIGAKIADYFSVDQSEIRVIDLKVHPQTKMVYLAAHVGFAQEKTSHILTVDVKGNISEIDYSAYPSSSIKLVDPGNEDITFEGNNISARTFTITDVDYYKGFIYVAGLSNEDFASTLKTLQYPFTGKYETTNTEMYHTTHNQMETRAPIRTMTILELNGVDTLFAGYTCTPMVTIPIDSLKDDQRVSAKTIVEIGYANSPIDVLAFKAPTSMSIRGPSASMTDFVLVTNTHKGASLFKVSDIAEYDQGKGLTTPVMFGDVAGVEFSHVPLIGVLHVDEQDQQNIIVLKRNMQTGELDLLSIMKGSFFRQADFPSEANIASEV